MRIFYEDEILMKFILRVEIGDWRLEISYFA